MVLPKTDGDDFGKQGYHLQGLVEGNRTKALYIAPSSEELLALESACLGH